MCLRCERQNQLRCSIATLGAPNSFHSSCPTRPKQRDTLGIVLRERQRWDTSQCHASLTNHRIGHFSARCFDTAELLHQDLYNMGLLENNTPNTKFRQLYAPFDRRGENNGFDCVHACGRSARQSGLTQSRRLSADHKCWCGHSGRR